jgi:hypothetical protein
MAGVIIKVIIGLFIWMVLPSLLYNKRKYKKDTIQYFIYISCKIIGIAIVAFAIIGFVRNLLSI